MSVPSVSSAPILRATLLRSGLVTIVLLILAAIAGFAAAGVSGLWSALTGVALAALFLAITNVSILVANRWYGDSLYVPIFFGVVLGGWLAKFLVFLVLLLILRPQPWIEPTVFFLSVVVGVLAALAVDVFTLVRMRIPHASDVRLPTDPEEGERGSSGRTPRVR